jgi:HSP20 family protein
MVLFHRGLYYFYTTSSFLLHLEFLKSNVYLLIVEGGVGMNNRMKITPCACVSHDDQSGRLQIELELPGVDKKDISLEMRKDSFCVSAPRGEDTEYSGCFMLAHEVMPDKTEAKYESGLLQIFAPMKDWEHKVNVTVQ